MVARSLKFALLAVVIASWTIFRVDETSTAIARDSALAYLTADDRNITLPSAKSLLGRPPPYGEFDVIRPSTNRTGSPSTIVTAYFRVASKHTSDQYDEWMGYFLSLQDPMVVFTQPQLVEKIGVLRAHALDRTVIIPMGLGDLPVGRLYSEEFWRDQHERNYEKEKHKSIELYWIWLSKSWFVTEAIRLNVFGSVLFLWSDIGAFRDAPKFRFETLILHPEQVPPHEMMQMAFQEPNPPEVDLFWDKEKYRANFYHSGMQAVAFKDTWEVFHEHFLDTVDRFLERGMLICDDQVILQSLCLSRPEMCAYVPASQVRDYRFRALRYVLHYGGSYRLWRYNKTISNGV